MVMKDLTERKLVYLDDAIEALNEYFARIGKLKRRGLTIEEKAIHLDMVDAIKALPSAQQWIPRDKGEPDEDMECWVTVKTTDALYRGNFTKRYGERRDKGFITSGGFMWWNTALAWMPIYEPEPYRTEGDDNHEG